MDSRGFVSEDQGECSESAQHYYQKNIELQKELYEYMDSSSLLEKELEASLDQKEKLIRELRQQNQKLDRENEFIKKKMDRTQQENTQLENEVKSMKIEKENRRIYIRELEQKNDDLERAQRVISESVAGIETLLNQAYERNAVLESELEEVENLRMKLQRASDETRDLKQELRVKDRIPNGNVTSTPIQSANDTDNSRRLLNGLNGLDSSRLHNESDTTNTQPTTPLKCDFSMNGMNGNTMTPSSRISALNIVGDLLRKVGLERFLCPECSKVRCICPKSDKDIPPQSVHPSDNHQPVNRNLVRNLFSPSSPDRPQIPPTQNENGLEKDNKRNSMPEPQSPERHWLSGLMNSNSPSANQNGHGRPNSHHTSNVELRHNHAMENSNSPVQRAEPPAPRTLSLFSRGTSFRRSTVPPRPPRSPTKSRPTPPS